MIYYHRVVNAIYALRSVAGNATDGSRLLGARGTDFSASRTEINEKTERHAVFGAKAPSNAVKKCMIYRQIERGKERR
jgi:hypothetical protein